MTHLQAHNKCRSMYGFTLIELLVVIAIIALLAAILFPVFSTAREKARQSACESNEKQIGLAFQQYCQDYDEASPYTIRLNTSYVGNGAAGWQPVEPLGVLLNPYAKSYDMWYDLSDNDISVTQISQAGSLFQRVSYAYNFYFMEKWSPLYTVGSTSVPGNNPALLLSQMQTPALDAIVFGSWDGSTAAWLTDNPSALNRVEGNANGENQIVIRGHNYGGNFLFGDGHVKWLTGSYIAAQAALESANSNPERAFGTYPTIFHE